MDTHPMVEEWIGGLIRGESEIVFAGHAAGLADAESVVARARPSLLLLEIAADVPLGLSVLGMLKVKFPKLRMLVFSSCEEVGHSVQALRAGAHGFVSKEAGGLVVMNAIRHVLGGGVYLSSAMIERLAEEASTPAPAAKNGPAALLSVRELQVFTFIGEGLHPTEIAQRISLSVKTVESYLSRIRGKLNLRDAHALFQDAVKWSKTWSTADER